MKAEILVVDDTPDNLRLLLGILEEQGYTVRPAADGFYALSTARANPPDLILLDIKMPEINGYEVCEQLKADERTRDIPVIFISALNNVADKVKGLEIGGVDYITKPFQAEEVLARVHTHVTLHNLQRHLEDLVDARTAELQQEITERRRAEAQLKTALDHKIILLREIHHRTKNNMQVMSSLIGFHTKDINDPEILRIFQNLKERINAMALVHEQLHQPDLTMVDLQEYIPRLAQRLLENYQLYSGRITMTYDLAPVIMPVDTAVPLSMVLNELICNALKHAFPDERKGELHLILQVTEEGQKDLWVRDNGIGLPQDADRPKTKSVGAEIVKLITEYQLQGTVEFEKVEAGTSVHIRFKEPTYKPRI